MSEWWTYRPGDFLMFAPDTYWRLFELHNARWWPLHVPLLAGICAFVGWGARRAWPPLRAGAAGVAALWAFVGSEFLLQRYAQINWASGGFAAAFMLQAGVLALLASRGDLCATRYRPRRAIGALLVGWAFVVHPMLAVVAGRPWTQAEVFGMAPDPTAIATLGVLLWADPATRTTRMLLRAARVVPLAWCAIASATLLTMGSSQGWVPVTAAAVTVFALLAGGRRRGHMSPGL